MVWQRSKELLDQSKQAKMKWLQNHNEINWDNLNNVRYEARKHFRNKNKDKINEFAMNSKNKNIRELY
jgi:hypothetical protein